MLEPESNIMKIYPDMMPFCKDGNISECKSLLKIIIPHQ